MTIDMVAVHPTATLKQAIELMENRPSQLTVLPVVEDGKCLGLIRIHDIYQH
jgi:arabinose-5-phosphate isomerase